MHQLKNLLQKESKELECLIMYIALSDFTSLIYNILIQFLLQKLNCQYLNYVFYNWYFYGAWSGLIIWLRVFNLCFLDVISWTKPTDKTIDWHIQLSFRI